MLNSFFIFVEFFIIIFAIGIFPVAFIFSRNKTSELLFLIPLFGISILTIFSTIIVNSNIPFSRGLINYFLMTYFFLQIVYFSISKNKFFEIFSIKYFAFLILSVIFCYFILIFPVIGLNLSIPWRIGPDAAGYVNSAEYLIKGSTLTDFSGNFSIPGSIYAYEFLIQVIRRGLAGDIAAISLLLNLHPTQSTFIFLIIFYLILGLLVVHFVINHITKNYIFLLISFILIILNCNLLFILYEGGYAQIASMPFIFLVCTYFTYNNSNSLNIVKSSIFFGILIAASISLYLESLFIIFPILLINLIINILKNFKHYLLLLLLTSLIIIIIDYPIITNWLKFQNENANLLSLAGWPQPQWALLTDIFGFQNIYSGLIGNQPSYLNDKNSFEYIFSILVSVFIIYYILNNKSNFKISLFIIPLILITSSYFYIRYYKLVHSYAYMKIYTLCTPFLVIALVNAFYTNFKINKNRLFILATCLVVLNGFLLLKNYKSSYKYISKGAIELSLLDFKSKFQDGIFLFFVNEDSQFNTIEQIFLRSLIWSDLIHPGFIPQQNFSNSHRHVYLIFNINDIHNLSCIYDQSSVLWRGSEYIILDTGLSLSSGINNIDNFWLPQAKIIPRPEIELQWWRNNLNLNNLKNFDIKKFTSVVKCNDTSLKF